ncbi:MAG: ribonucleotide-diphosphate reductase subunit alpha, partial [Alphaproteobacteria bacterium]
MDLGRAVQYADGARVEVEHTRDSRLTVFGKAVLEDRYLLPGEKPQDLFARVAGYYGDDDAHAKRL